MPVYSPSVFSRIVTISTFAYLPKRDGAQAHIAWAPGMIAPGPRVPHSLGREALDALARSHVRKQVECLSQRQVKRAVALADRRREGALQADLVADYRIEGCTRNALAGCPGLQRENPVSPNSPSWLMRSPLAVTACVEIV